MEIWESSPNPWNPLTGVARSMTTVGENIRCGNSPVTRTVSRITGILMAKSVETREVLVPIISAPVTGHWSNVFTEHT